MAGDDNETSEETPAETSATPTDAKGKPASALPPRVERALARAREAAQADRARKEGRWLAIVPLTVGALLLLLLMPRSTTPDSVPLPRTDMRVLRAVERADDARAAAGEAAPLPGDIRALGDAIRAVNRLEAHPEEEAALVDARRALTSAVADVVSRPDFDEDLLVLRAVETRRFVDAVAHWEKTGESTPDLAELGGSFIQKSADAGWVSGRKIALDESQRRVAFKTVWNALVGLETRPSLALTLDEQRELYAFYLTHPRVAEMFRLGAETRLRAATTPDACATARADVARQKQLWLAEKIKRLGDIDPTYPTAYALGVAYYRATRYDLAAESFTSYLDAHRDGPYAIRARNHLKASLAATSF